MFLEPKKVKTKVNFITPREHLQTYLKWIEYIPKHWNIEELLNKKASELTNEEIELLKLINEENKYKEIFKQRLTGNENMITISNEVHNYIGKMPIDKYANIKLTEEELEHSKKIISNCSTIEEVELAISKLKQKEDRNLSEEYILFELKQKAIRLGIRRLNSGIRKSVEENRKQDLHGYEKCINKRNRF